MIHDFTRIDHKFVELLLEEYFSDNNNVVNDFYVVKIIEDEEKKVYRFKVWLFRVADNKVDGFSGYLKFYRNKVVMKLPSFKEFRISDEILFRAMKLYEDVYLRLKGQEVL